MTSLKPATALEKVAGHPLTEAAMEAIAAFSGTPLAAVLPVLSNTLANGRHKARVAAGFAEVNDLLSQDSAAIQELSDSQYKLINETVLALLHTVDERKIEYLKQVINGTIKEADILPQEAAMLSRVLRDITAEEVDFLVKNFGYIRVIIGSPSEGDLNDKCLWVTPNTHEALIVRGLASLGMISGVDTTFNYNDDDCFSVITAKLMAILGIRRTV